MLIIAMTGWGQDHDRLRTVDVGFDAHLVKPVDPQELIALLATKAGIARANSTDTSVERANR